MNEDQKDLLNLLQPLNIEARYPEDKELLIQALDQGKCADILERTEELSRWTKQQL